MRILGKDAPQLLICGKGPLEEWVQKYVKEHQLKSVKMLGFVPNEQVKELIGQSKALILPTQVYEGFPMTIAESYAYGTPVIGSELGNTGSLIEHGKTGLKFKYNSPESLAKAINEMLKISFEVSDEMIHRYSKEKNYKQLRDIYETCSNHY